MRLIICTAPVYKFKGWLFDYKPHVGAWPLKKDGEPRARAGMKFWTVFDEFFNLPEDEQRKYRVGGGCLHG